MKLKIGFFGGGEQALAVLDQVVNVLGHQIVFIHPRWADDHFITSFSMRHAIPILEATDVNAPSILQRLAQSGADLFLSVNAKQIFRRPLLDIPQLGAINMHNGLLPRQRGGGGAYVGLINGESCGATVHFIDEGIDSGDIIAQTVFNLPPSPKMSDVIAAAVRSAPMLIETVLRQFENGCVQRTPQQNEPFYYVPAKPDWDELIDWTLTTDAILTRLRARTPGPSGTYLWQDAVYRVLTVQSEPLLLAHTNAPGQVIARKRDFGVLVKTGDTGVWITAVSAVDGGPSLVPDYKVGSMLYQNLHREVHVLKLRIAELEAAILNGRRKS